MIFICVDILNHIQPKYGSKSNWRFMVESIGPVIIILINAHHYIEILDNFSFHR